MKTDLSATTRRILTEPHPELPYLSPELIFPRYDGYCVANLAATVAGWLGGEPAPGQLPPLRDGDTFGDDFDHVLIVLIDGVGETQLTWLRTMIPDNPFLKRVEAEGIETRLTSIVPSSTAAALTSIWTGVPAGRHGLIGYDTFLKDYGMVVNFLAYSPVTLMHMPGLVENAGRSAEEMFEPVTMGENLSAQGFASRSYLPIAISTSCLTRAQMRGSRVIPYRGFSDLYTTVFDNLVAEPSLRSLDFIYYNDIDTYNHQKGMTNERIWLAVDQFLLGLERLIQHIQQVDLGKTLVLVTADHGHIPNSPDPNRDLNNHPEILELLTVRPTGENRLTYFFPKCRHAQELPRLIDSYWPGEFTFVESERFLADGFFGPAPYHRDVHNRIGELIAIAHGGSYFWWPYRPDRLKSRHGGLTADEMIVPLVGIRI